MFCVLLLVLYLFGPLSLGSFISWVLYLFGPLSRWSFISWVLYLFGHCIVCHSIRSFELPLWYLWVFLNCSESLFVYLSSPSFILCLPIKRIGSRIYYCINILIYTTYTYSLIELRINSYKIQYKNGLMDANTFTLIKQISFWFWYVAI